ncbi:hypothetical protein MNB_SM-7-1329 [hydrothermal vent metagenome]|uniref:Uncharacterized protein n=1 Tax=hydrothermal vent metagenome TaxID=652676 RepID=A0A1W1BY09_9ZZZZ
MYLLVTRKSATLSIFSMAVSAISGVVIIFGVWFIVAYICS